MRNLLSFKWIFPYRQGVVFLWLLSTVFSLSLFLKGLVWCVLAWTYFYLSILLSFFNPYAYVSCQIWRLFSHFFFEHVFIPFLFLLSLEVSNDRSIRYFTIVSQVPEALLVLKKFLIYFLIFDYFWSLLFRLGNFYCFPVHAFFLLSFPFSCWAHPLSFLFWFCIFQYQNFYLLLPNSFYFFDEDFYFFICFKHICNCSLKHFCHDWFTIFVILTPLSSQCWHLLSFIMQPEIILVLGMASDLRMKPGYVHIM